MLRSKGSARNRMTMIGILAAVTLGSFGCATQTWVVETIREMDKELVARFEKDEAAAAAETVRVNGQLNEIRGIAVDGRNRAIAGDARMTQYLANRLKRAQVQTLDVLFDTGKADVSATDRTALQGLLKVLADNPTYTIDVTGYTDTVGKADENVNLSWRREEAVRRFLVDRGAELNRFYYIGVGEELSGDDTKDAAKRAKNRRVTVTIYKPVD